MRRRVWSIIVSLSAAFVAACTDVAAPTSAVNAARSMPQSPAFDMLTGSVFYQSFNWAEAKSTSYPDGWARIAPLQWHPTDFDVAIHSREPSTWYTPNAFAGMHGPDCVPYQDGAGSVQMTVGSHPVGAYDDMNYRCRNHMMTAVKAVGGYGLIYVTPNAMVDFSAGEASIKFALATLRVSGRDWVDIWITPWEDNLKLPLDASLSSPSSPTSADMQGPPRRAIHVRMIPELTVYTQSAFEAYYVSGFNEYKLNVASKAGYEAMPTNRSGLVVPISTRRDTFELRISPNHLSFAMWKTMPAKTTTTTTNAGTVTTTVPAVADTLKWIDTSIPTLSFTRGVVQFGHHSFAPEAAWNRAIPPKTGGTWHWDDFTITPAVPFTIITPTTGRYADASTPSVTFAAPTPANAYLRFAAYGDGIQVSADGVRWFNAPRQAEKFNVPGRFHSYWFPVPAGYSTVYFRNVTGDEDNPVVGGTWIVRDVAVWSQGASAAAASSWAQAWGGSGVGNN